MYPSSCLCYHTRTCFVALLVFALTACSEPAPADDSSGGNGNSGSIITLSAAALASALSNGELSAGEVTRAYLARIEALNRQGPELKAVLEVNANAVAEAEAIDQQFEESGPVGALHGVPVLIKGNIDVAGLHSSAGSLALADEIGPVADDAFLVAQLRQAGAVILGTANLSEWANFRDQKSSSGWSSQGGQTRNPHVLDRNPCGSSSGSAAAVAARLVPLAIGTETNGSIVCPASANGVVGIKPTLGLVSRRGIIPISPTQDTAGPMGRSVTDAAMLLEAITAFDADDPAPRSKHPPRVFNPTRKSSAWMENVSASSAPTAVRGNGRGWMRSTSRWPSRWPISVQPWWIPSSTNLLRHRVLQPIESC